MKLFNAPIVHYRWLQERISCELTSSFKALEVREDAVEWCHLCHREHGRIAGMVGFSGWTHTSAAMHIHLEKPHALVLFLRHVFRYLFGANKLRIALALTQSTNLPTCSLLERAGFKRRATIEHGFAENSHLVLYELRQEDCRWPKEAP